MPIFGGQTKKKTSELELASYLVKKEEELRKKEEELEKEKEKTSGLSKDEARKLVLEETEKKLAAEISRKIKEAEDEIKATAAEIAKEVLVEAMRHGVTDWVSEYTVSTIRLADEEIKGRIIGREGRNIRAFEQATGVEIELDETLDLRISSFDSIRREIAKISLEKLIRDGRIQPGRIEELVSQTKKQMEHILFEEGRKICHSVGVYNLHPDLIKTIGKYKYRFSFGQNLAQHTIEETKIGVAIALELKADINTVRLGCLLHDIGKVITEEEGTHVELGVEFLKKYRISEKVIAAVAEHHEDKPFSSIESAIVWIADSASGSRPGARYEPIEEYLKRMTHIEELVKSFPQVSDVAAYQGGGEIRVIVKPEEVLDSELPALTKKIAEKLEEEARAIGQIKVVAIRETRATETAK